MALVQKLQEENYDVLVIGAGVAGMEAAVDLGDMGFRVLLVDREPSIGGHMYLLSKVFPTLDCATASPGRRCRPRRTTQT